MTPMGKFRLVNYVQVITVAIAVPAVIYQHWIIAAALFIVGTVATSLMDKMVDALVHRLNIMSTINRRANDTIRRLHTNIAQIPRQADPVDDAIADGATLTGGAE